MHQKPADLRRAALAEARRMMNVTAGAESAKQVSIAVADFRKLAALIEGLASAEPAPADPDGFDVPVDGIRVWVPLPHFKAVVSEAAALRDELAFARSGGCLI